MAARNLGSDPSRVEERPTQDAASRNPDARERGFETAPSSTPQPADATAPSSTPQPTDAAVASAFLASTVGGESGAGPDGVKRRRARFHPLEVAEVRPLTTDAVEVTFSVPDQLADEYTYLPGQYVALRAELEGHERRRSYSICRPPERGSISVAIKRDLGGIFSTWANSELKAGDTLDVMSPQGTFTS
ncbi:MAG TPA: FAD-binding oxidoreductase, partial [Agromyces sp.]|nr:FAD-binding oxidoreductase [Agromyces sp.]